MSCQGFAGSGNCRRSETGDESAHQGLCFGVTGPTDLGEPRPSREKGTAVGSFPDRQEKNCGGKNQKGGHAFLKHPVHGTPSLVRRKKYLPRKGVCGKDFDYNRKRGSGKFCP
jgi:hypothetical protein